MIRKTSGLSLKAHEVVWCSFPDATGNCVSRARRSQRPGLLVPDAFRSAMILARKDLSVYYHDARDLKKACP